MASFFKKILFLFVPLLVGVLQLTAQEYKIYDSLPQLQERIRQAGDSTTLVINFWATWCKPCVEELPCFEELQAYYKSQNVQVILVSLDFKSQLEKKFIPFLKNQKLNCEVVLFSDQDTNEWMPQIEEEWDGAIPATVVFQGPKQGFNLGKFENFGDLEDFVLPFLTEKKNGGIKNFSRSGSGK